MRFGRYGRKVGQFLMVGKKIIMVSGKARSGKDTFCQYYIDCANEKGVRAERMAFADRLKYLAKELGWNGSKEGEGRSFLIDIGQILRDDYFVRNGKVISKLTGLVTERETYSLRHLYEMLLDKYVPKKDIWVQFVQNKILESDSDIFIIPDWRFQNEKASMEKFVLDRPGNKLVTVRIENNRALNIDDPSEKDLDTLWFNHILFNEGTLEDFKTVVEKFFVKEGKII